MAERIFVAKGLGSSLRSAESNPPARTVIPSRGDRFRGSDNQGGTAKLFVPDFGGVFLFFSIDA